MPDDRVTVPYFLPETIVRFSGSVVRSTNGLDTKASAVVERTGQAELVVQSDRTRRFTLELTTEDWATVGAKLNLTDEGLVTGLNVTSEGTGFDFASGLLGVVAFAAGTALTLATGGAAPAIAAGVLASGAAAVSKGGAQKFHLARPEAQLPSLEELGIHDEYAKDHPPEAEVLRRYRFALLQLTTAHADAAREAAVSAEAGRVKSLEKALRSARREVDRLEAHYDLWKRSKVESTTTMHDFLVPVADLPTQQAMRDEFREGAVGHTEAWWKSVDELGIAVTCDWVEGLAANATEDDGKNEAGKVALRYRASRRARMATWKVQRRVGANPEYKAELVKVHYVRVAGAGPIRRLVIDPDAFKKAELSVGFSPSGDLLELGMKNTPASAGAATVLADLPGALSGAVKSGADTAALLRADARRTAALNARIAYLEARKKHDGLVTPPKVEDELADLKKELSKVQLDAQLALARAIRDDPHRVNVTTPAWSD